MKKRLFAGLLTFVMMFNLMSAAVFATEQKAGEVVEVDSYEKLLAELAKDGANVKMTANITATATESNGYGKTGVLLEKEDVLDGNGYTLTINGANGTWDSVVAMKGGEVKNLTIAGAMRGVFMPGANGDVIIDNCEFKDVIYTFNSDAGSKEHTVAIKNTTLNGWTSFSDVHKSVTFDNCEFGEGSGYAFCRPYQATTFTDCTFKNGFELDTSKTAKNTLVFNGCTYNGEALSAENNAMFYNGGKVVIDGKNTNVNSYEIVSTYEELLAALNKDEAMVKLANDITATATEGSSYGKTGINLNNGDVLDGNGYTLTINGANGTWDSVIAMTGGEVKNLTIAGAMRGVFMPGANGDVTIDNCEFKDVIYTFNSDAGSKEHTVTIKNTILDGWTSFSAVHKSVTFDNCEFGEGSGYAFCRPYQATTFTDCEFENGFKLDTSKVAENTLVFNGCTYNGEALSAENNAMFYNGGKVIIDDNNTDVNHYVAKIDNDSFLTLQEAVNKAVAGDTITLLKDVELADTLNVDKSITIDGQNYKIEPADTTKTYNSAIMAGNSDWGDDHGETITLKNLNMSGWKTSFGVVRAQGITLNMEDCELSGNSVSNEAYGVLSLNFTDAAVTGSKFENNTSRAIDINYNGDNSNAVVTIDGCAFTNNTSAGAGIVVRNDGEQLIVKNSTFKNNIVNTAGNAATIYVGWGEEDSVTGCIFDGNTVTTSHATTKRFASAIFCDGCTVTGNVFTGNTATRNGETISTIVAVGAYYGPASLNDNYWGGHKPVEGKDYFVEFKDSGNTVTINNYKCAYTLEGNTIVFNKLVSVAEVSATCTATGIKAHYKCDTCGKTYSDAAGTTLLTDLVASAKGHNYSGKSDSSGHWSQCSRCGDVKDKEGHSYSNGKCSCGHETKVEVHVPETPAPAPTAPAPAPTTTTQTTTQTTTTTKPVEAAKPVETPVEEVVVDTKIVEEAATEEVKAVVKETVTVTEVKEVEKETEAGKVTVTEVKVAVTAETVDKVIENTEAGATVILPLTEAVEEGQAVTEAEVSVEALEKIVEAEAALTVEFEGVKVTLEADTIKAIAEQAQGSTIELRVVPVEHDELNEEQQNVLEAHDVAVCVSAQIFSDGEYIGDFKGGKATIAIPFTPEEGKAAEDHKVYFVDDNGEMTLMPAVYVDGHMVFETTHFSDYVIVYDEVASAEEGPSPVDDDMAVEAPVEDVQEEAGLPIIPIIIVVVAVILVVAFIATRNKKDEE